MALNGGYQASSLTFDDTRGEPVHAETASWTADYKVEAGPSLDVGAGIRIWRDLAVIVGTSSFMERTSAGVSAQIPHPFFFNRARNLTGETPALKHTERAVHVGAAWIIAATDRVQLTMFGGPSLFSIKRDLVEDIDYTDSYPYDEAAYNGAIIRSVSHVRTGFNAGIDASFFVTETVGFGAGVRLARAQAQLRSPATGKTVPVDAGGTQASVGVRLRFGSAR